MADDLPGAGFETRTTGMEPVWLVTFQAPVEEADTIMDTLAGVAPLTDRKSVV